MAAQKKTAKQPAPAITRRQRKKIQDAPIARFRSSCRTAGHIWQPSFPGWVRCISCGAQARGHVEVKPASRIHGPLGSYTDVYALAPGAVVARRPTRKPKAAPEGITQPRMLDAEASA